MEKRMLRIDLWIVAAGAVLFGLASSVGWTAQFGSESNASHGHLSSLGESASPLGGTAGSCVYLVPPQDFVAQMDVSGCFCEHGDRVLFLLRNPDKPQGNTWCVPGGKLECGETPRQAVVREVREETGIELDERTLIYCHKVYIRFPEKDLNLHIFRSVLREVPSSLEIAPEEHTSWCWVTLEEALQMPLIPGGSDCLRVAFAEREK